MFDSEDDRLFNEIADLEQEITRLKSIKQARLDLGSTLFKLQVHNFSKEDIYELVYEFFEKGSTNHS